MPVVYSNNASTSLSSGITNSDTSITVGSVSSFPVLSGGDYYYATLANVTNTKIEIIKVTNVVGSVLTVLRGQDGTTAVAFDANDNVQLRVTSATLEAATKTDVDITGGVIASSIVDSAGAVMESDSSTASMSFVVDEDTMASNSATKLPTQQSVKAYVDSQVQSKDALSELSGSLDDIADGSTYVKSTNDFTDADHSKLDGIEASADVTDTANVTTAGALMDSEVTNLAQVKAFNSADYATASHNHSGVYEPADATILKDADIDVTVLSPTGDGSGLTGINTDLVADTTPQLGGNLDLNNNNITGTGNIPSGNLTGALPAIDGSALTGVQPFPSGTKMVFAQASAPTGWTQDTSNNDKALRVVSGSGGGTGGTHGLSSPPGTSHSHTGPSHTHSTPNHSHSHNLSAGAHTLSTAQMPSHSHGYGTNNSNDTWTNCSTVKQVCGAASHTRYTSNTGGSSSHSHSLAGSISSGGAGTSGSGGTGATSSSGPTAFAPRYVDVIVCSKD